jgi:hypothetical protein
VGSVRLDWGEGGFASNIVVSVSTNRTDWEDFGEVVARAGDFDVVMGRAVHPPARYVRLQLEGGSGVDGRFEVAELTFRGEEGLARPWGLMEVAAEQAPEGLYPAVFHRQQAYWTIAGGWNRGDAEALLNEEGAFAPQADGPSLWPLLLMNGEVLGLSRAVDVTYELGAGGAPMPAMTMRYAPGIVLRIQAMARMSQKPEDPAPGRSWVRYEVRNDSLMTQTGRLCLVVRPVKIPPPWTGGGLAPLYHIRGVPRPDGAQELWANGLSLFTAMADPGVSLSFGAAAFREGDAVRYLVRREWPTARTARDVDGLASALWGLDFALEPGQRKNLVVSAGGVHGFHSPAGHGRVQEDPPDGPARFEQDWEEAEWDWRGEVARFAPKLARPDAIDCLHAQVGWLLSVRGEEGSGGNADEAALHGGYGLDAIQAGVAALFRVGQPARAREWITNVAAHVQANGWVPSMFSAAGQPLDRMEQEGRHAAQGQFAFMLMEDYRFTQDAIFLQKHYGALRQALVYLQELRKSLERAERRMNDEERSLLEGLLPLSGARPGHPRPSHLYADQFWALLAWKEGRRAASLLGHPADAVWMDEQYRLLKNALRRSLRNKMDTMSSTWIPTSPEDDRLDISSVALLFWPCAETDLVEPHELQSSLDAFYEDFLARLHPGWNGRISLEDLRLLAPLAQMGRGDYAREVLYDLLKYRVPSGWHTWGHVVGSDPRQPGVVGWMPDGHAAADYINALRSLVAREEGRRLELFCGTPAEWLQHGDGIQVYGMPTQFGPLDLSGYWNRDRLTLEIGGSARPSEGYRIWWPRQILPLRVTANGELLKTVDAVGCFLPYDFKGTVEVEFPFPAPWPRDP